jgi:arylsulfatase A-like enzyme
MAARFDIGGALGTAVFGSFCGFVVAFMYLRPWLQPRAPHARVPSAEVGAAHVGLDPAASPLAAPVAQPVQAPRRTYNVLLLTVDTLRFDLGYTGYPKPITPNIDALAARSTVFEHAYATASFTPKSLGPMLIGKYASETSRDYEHYTTFYPSNVFLAERIHAAGVRTFAGMCHRYFTFNNGLRQGFDLWDTTAMPHRMTDNDRRTTSDRLSDVALSLLEKPENTGARRFFAWFHYFDPHLPYVPHAGAPDFRTADTSRAGRARAAYDEEVWFTDSQIGRVLSFVATQPWAADTAIVLTADHGEAFGEHDHWAHGRELWEPLVRVPLIVYLPGVAPQRIAVKRSHIDLAPTLMELTGAPLPSDLSLRGTSLVSDILRAREPGAPLPERDVYIDMPQGPFNEMRRAHITGASPGTKLIDVAGRRFELYDLANDPDERENLAGDKARLAPFVDAFSQWRAQLHELPSR